jgi:hypothetical protein
MITSGLLVQNRGFGTYPSSNSRERISAHPYVYGFDSVPVKTTEFHNTNLKIPPSVNYNKIFGRGLTPSEKDHFLTHGKTMIQKAAQGVVAGRARRGILKRKNTNEMNDSFKNLQSYSDWKDFHERDRSQAMSGVDPFGEQDKYFEEIARQLRAGAGQNFQQRVLPDTSESIVVSKAASPARSRLGSIAGEEEVNAMQMDPQPETDKTGISDLFAARLGDINDDAMIVEPGSMPPPPPPPPPSSGQSTYTRTTEQKPKPSRDVPEISLAAINDARGKLRPAAAVEREPLPLTFHDELMNAIKANAGTLKKRKNSTVLEGTIKRPKASS